jgi:hypothetical protein
MDYSILFNVILLVFTLMLVGAIVYVPYKILHFTIRGIAKTTQKTVEVFIPSKR